MPRPLLWMSAIVGLLITVAMAFTFASEHHWWSVVIGAVGLAYCVICVTLALRNRTGVEGKESR
jgi:predicted lysophospholipase L1 biosynthesis ABC-type transport system permease subunit